jgi:hypothetical protein
MQQHPKQQQDDSSSSKLIAKLTNKIMKQRKHKYIDSTATATTTTTEGTKRNSCVKPAIVMPSTMTATTMSSLSSLEPSVSSSPWATEVDNDFFHRSSTTDQSFFNEKMNDMGGPAIMGEITDKHINRFQPPQKPTTTTTNNAIAVQQDQCITSRFAEPTKGNEQPQRHGPGKLDCLASGYREHRT